MSEHCSFCFRRCLIPDGGSGWCGERMNVAGTIVPAHPGMVVALSPDPVEKKPLHHFLPGTRTLSAALPGCCFDCDFCQNHSIAKDNPGTGEVMPPGEFVALALEMGLPSVSFTYTEPLVWQDYVAEASAIARGNGIRTIMVTNGAFSPEALERLLPLVDAFNVDLKGDAAFYRDTVHGAIEPVLEGIRAITKAGLHLEVTTMAIEGVHDLPMMQSLCGMLGERGVKVWHISAFHPMRRLKSARRTSAQYILGLAESLSGRGIDHIYPGNVASRGGMTCPSCGSWSPAVSGKCPSCGREIYGVFS